ncbi:MAG: DUF362 domain-containing protein [Candidatus Aminicenantes bacterium]|nr:DUF362 domain-containing protein [Candidatus Aminicenantes bacterium]
MKKIIKKNISRRDFIKNSALGVVGVAMSGELLNGEKVKAGSSSGLKKSSVVVVRHSGVIKSSGELKQDIVDMMVAKGIVEFTCVNNESEAWRKFYSPGDMIGLKVNTLGLNAIRGSGWVNHFSAVTGSVARGLRNSGHSEENIIVWDRSDGELENAGFKLSKDPAKMMVSGILASRRDDKGDLYTKKSFKVGDKSVRLAKILTEKCSTLINIPLIKHHRNAGVTGAMKSHFGTIDNPFEFHSPGCVNPGIPEINALPEIKNKQKLIVVDGLMGLFDGGPWWDRRFVFPFGRIIIGTDPVAVDSVILGILDEKRKDAGKEPLAPKVKFLELSEKLGLGNSKKENIEIKELILG